MTHDQTTPAPVDVTPKDREAYLALNTLPPDDAADVHAGRWDHTTGMQVIARHGRHSAPTGEVVTQWRRIGSGPWWDGLPDHEDRSGPYETRTLYAHPAPPADVVELVDLLRQYRSDLLRPPAPDSRERRIAAIDAALAKWGR